LITAAKLIFRARRERRRPWQGLASTRKPRSDGDPWAGLLYAFPLAALGLRAGLLVLGGLPRLCGGIAGSSSFQIGFMLKAATTPLFLGIGVLELFLHPRPHAMSGTPHVHRETARGHDGDALELQVPNACSRVRSSRRKGATRPSISSAFTRASRSRFGGTRLGFILTILGAGSSGLVVTSEAGAWRTTLARSGAGRQCVATFVKSSAPARKATCSAAHAHVRRSYTGLMMPHDLNPRRLDFSRAPT
jgi:hypothetical protein